VAVRLARDSVTRGALTLRSHGFNGYTKAAYQGY
jgi:hypothetical protein